VGSGFADLPGGACGASPRRALGPPADPARLSSEGPPALATASHRADLARCSRLRDKPLRPLGSLGVLQCKARPRDRHSLANPIDLDVPICLTDPEGLALRALGRLLQLPTKAPTEPHQAIGIAGLQWVACPSKGPKGSRAIGL
jgi:hypothetical protein